MVEIIIMYNFLEKTLFNVQHSSMPLKTQ